MKRLIAITLAIASIYGVANAELISPKADGFLARGIAMYNDRNYNGCIDQLTQLRNFTLTPNQKEDAVYFMAMATLYSGDDEAVALLKEFLSLYPQSPRYQEVTKCIGDYYFSQALYEEAINWYQGVNPKALNADSDVELRYRKGYSLMMLRRYVEARPVFGSLTGTREYGNAANFYLAYMTYDEKNYAEALNLFNKVNVNVEPGTAAPYYMSQIYFLESNYTRALDLALTTIKSKAVPEFLPEANRIAGESYYNLGHTNNALPYLWRYASDCKEPEPSTLYILGISEYDNGKYDAAIPLLQKATKAEGRIEQAAWLYLGQSYLKTNNPDGALLSFEKAYTNGSDPVVTETAFYNYIVARTAGGRVPFANTVGMFEEFLQKFPRSRYASTIQESLIYGYMNDDDYESALSALNKIDNPNESLRIARQRVLLVLGSRSYSAGRYEDAAELLQQATTGLDKDASRQATLWLADCNYETGNYDKAAEGYLSYTSEATNNDLNRALAFYSLGYTHYKQMRYPEAVADFTTAIDLTKDNRIAADAYNRIGDSQYQQHDFGQAADSYRKAYERNKPTGDYALYQLAVMCGLQEKYAEQHSELNKLIADYPSSSLVPAAILDKAEAYVAQENTDKAIATYKSLIREYGANSYGRQGYLQLAVTQFNAGMTEEAIDTYKEVVTNYPTSAEAKLAVDDLKRILAADNRLDELNSFLVAVPNSPQLSASELDAVAFHAAEDAYLNTSNTDGLRKYLVDYPEGANLAQAYYYLSEAAYEAGDLERALEYVNTITLSHPDSEVADDATLLKANIEAANGNDELALEAYRTLEQKAAGSRIINDARLGIMRTAMKLHRFPEVLVTTDKLMASSAVSSNDMPEIRFTEAEALDLLGRHDEAYKVWKELAAQPNTLYGAMSAVTMAQSLFNNGRVAEASTAINKFINANSPQQYWQARAFILLSDILRKQGNLFEATEYLQALRANYPGQEPDIFEMINTRIDE